MGHGCSHLQPRSTKIRIYAEDVSDFTHASMVGVGPLMMEALPSGQEDQEDLTITKATVSSKSSSCSSLHMEGPDENPPAAPAIEKIKGKEIKDRPIKERDKHKEPPKAKEGPPRRTASRSEEPTSTQHPRGRGENSPNPGDRPAAGVETVDRGVGPTPLPQPLPDPRLPPYFGIPPYPDPRNGLEHSQLSYLYGSPYAPFGINVPIPVTSQTHEGRYQWPPSMALPSPSHGLPTNPNYSELYGGMGGRPLSAGAERVTEFANRIQWEQLQQYRQMLSSSSLAAAAAAASHRGFSPTRGFSPVLSGFGSLLPQPPPGSALSHRSMFSEHPAAPSGSVTLPGSLESSRLTSPRPSIIGKGGRKRALSHSPFSDCYLDIEGLTRSSGGSLQLPFAPGNSRSSSATSGSYGHLSAASFGGSPIAHHGTPTHPLLRHPGLPTSPFMPPMVHPHMLSRQHMGLGPALTPVQPMVQPLGASKHESLHPSPHHASSTTARDPGSSVVSSTVEHSDAKKTRVKREEPDSPGSSDGKSSGPRSVDPQRPPVEGEPDFIETNCHWKGCNREHETQDELVRHINQDHIQSNKKAFVCQWTDCSREEKPFKAQYMLVVHMRRHTGEKPHRCTFEGCYKAYSRLENLKTHLRSHTGEKPYMCEFPGCTKAFSNASDRAKHQNRTHSNAKPYVCKAPNCNKRYTDPSSLRKHVKTVHGPDFYANKKHKGDPSRSHNGGDGKGSDKRSGGNDDQHPGGGSAGECGPRSVTTIKTEGGDSNDGFGTSGEQPRQNQSSSENGHSDNSPLSNQSDLGEGEDGNPVPSGPVGVADIMVGDDEEADYNSDDDGEDILLPATTVGVATANRVRCAQPTRLKNRLNAKAAITGLPPIGNSQRRQDNTSKSKHSPPHRRTITDLISQGSQESGIYLGSLRRDSNTSTLSSFISSGRSESSPFPGNQSHEVGTGGSNSRLSVSNSPYEYDIPSRHSRRSSESSNISHVAAQLEKARLGSQGSLNSTPLPPLRPPSTGSRSSVDRPVKGSLRCAPEEGWKIGTTSSTPTRTPIPAEVPSNRARRASDPIQCEEARQLQQRFNLNKPLTATKSSRSLDKPPSSCGRASNFHCGSNFRSSCSSIATDYDGHDAHGQYLVNGQEVNTMNENDLLITDEMQRFLNEQYQQTIQRQQADSTVQDCGASPRHMTPAPTQMYSRVSSRSSVNVPPSPQGPMASPAHAASPNNTMAAQGMSPGHMMSPGNIMQQQATPQPHMGHMNSPGHMTSPAHMMSPGSMPSPGMPGPGPNPQTGPMPSPGQMGQMAGPQMASSPWPQAQQHLHQHQQHTQQGVSKMDRSQCNSCQHPYNMPHNMTNGPQVAAEMMSPGQQQFNQQQQQFYNMQQQHQNFPQQQQPQMAMQQDVPQQQYGPYPAQHYEMYNQWRGQQGEGMPGYNGAPTNMYSGYNMQGSMNGMQKPERDSPMIQVPQISQSQQKRRGYGQQPHMSQQHPQQMMVDQFNQMPYQFQQHQQPSFNNNQFGGFGAYQMQHQQQQGQQAPQPQAQQQFGQMQGQNQNGGMMNQNMPVNLPQGRNVFNQGDLNERGNPNRPVCPPQGAVGVQMSPGHNQVSSTTDVKECQTDMESVLEENMHAVSTDNILDNLSSISMEHIPGQVMLSPTQLAMTRSASQTSSRMNTGTPYTDGKMSQASYLDTSNMVVNDMSSVLTQLAEENRYLNLR